MRTKEEDIGMTTLKTQCDHNEFILMPYGLKNAYAINMRLINHVFSSYLNIFDVIFIDKILNVF